jgi:hypothetical protein
VQQLLGLPRYFHIAVLQQSDQDRYRGLVLLRQKPLGGAKLDVVIDVSQPRSSEMTLVFIAESAQDERGSGSPDRELVT